MTNNTYKLENWEAISIIIIIMINKLILNIPYYVVSLVGTGVIINVIYIGIIDFIFSLLLVKLFDKFQNSDIIDVSEFLGGKVLKWIIGITAIIFFFIVAFITLTDFTNILQTIYFSNFPIMYILFFFLLGILVANLYGLKSITRVICFIVPFALISIIITLLGVWEDFNIENFTPFFGHNYYTTFVIGLSNCFSMYIINYYYFIKPQLKDSISFKKVVIISYGVCWLLLLLTIIPILTLFHVNTGNEPLNSLYLLSRKIELGNFLQRVDAIFILLWIVSIFSYLSFVVFLINKILKKLITVSNEKMLTFPTCSILFGLAIIPLNTSQIKFFENTLYRYLILGIVFGLGIFILIFANLKFKMKGKNSS